MKQGAKKPNIQPFFFETHSRSWEEVRYCWKKISGEDLSRERIRQIACEAMAKIRKNLEEDPQFKDELGSYL